MRHEQNTVGKVKRGAVKYEVSIYENAGLRQ